MRARSCGEIGRRAGFRFQWATVWVQVPSTAPNTEILLGVFILKGLCAFSTTLCV